MAYDGVIRDFRLIRELKTPKQVPCVACSEEFDVKWYGKYCYEEFCQDGDKIFEVYKAVIEEFDYDWAWVQIDDCFEFEPLGIDCPGEGNILRATHGVLPATRETLEGLPEMAPTKDGRMPEKLKAIRLLRDYFGDNVLVTGSCAGPYSACGLMWGIEEPMIMLMTEPALLYDTMEYWLSFYKRYIKAQQEAGAHAIWLGDCNAFSGMLSVEQFNQHIFSITEQLVDYAENELGIMTWLHNSEISIPHVESHIPLGISFENIGPDADIKAMRETTKGRHAISGNLDPIKVLWRGNPGSIAEDVERIMSICKEGGGYIFNTGEMNPYQTPAENMKAMMEKAKDLSIY